MCTKLEAIVIEPQAGSMADADQAHVSAQQLGLQQLLGRPIEGAGGLIEHAALQANAADSSKRLKPTTTATRAASSRAASSRAKLQAPASRGRK
jgi:hypothetical protein